MIRIVLQEHFFEWRCSRRTHEYCCIFYCIFYFESYNHICDPPRHGESISQDEKVSSRKQVPVVPGLFRVKKRKTPKASKKFTLQALPSAQSNCTCFHRILLSSYNCLRLLSLTCNCFPLFLKPIGSPTPPPTLSERQCHTVVGIVGGREGLIHHPPHHRYVRTCFFVFAAVSCLK